MRRKQKHRFQTDIFRIPPGYSRHWGGYIAYVRQFGLSHHVLELARLCPDAQKQKELLEACSGSLRSNGPLENNPLNSSSQLKHKKSSKKGKENRKDDGIGGSNGTLVNSIVNSARELQLNHKPSKGDEPTNLISGNQTLFGMRVQTHSQSTVDGSKNTLGTKVGGNEPLKKTSKFHRVWVGPVGESSSAAVLDLTNLMVILIRVVLFLMVVAKYIHRCLEAFLPSSLKTRKPFFRFI